MVELIVNVGLPLLLLVTGIVTNIMVNRNRARFLAVEEAKYRGRIELLNTKRFPDDLVCEKAVLVTGSVVVANNYFVAFASSWKNLFASNRPGKTAPAREAIRSFARMRAGLRSCACWRMPTVTARTRCTISALRLP